MPQELLILGAGPAGLSTALHLARLAPELASRILILEKARHPRHKLCAGALTVDAEVILQRLGLDLDEVRHADAARAHFDFAGKGLALAIRGSHALRMIRRDEFDAWLAGKARAAGIQIREGVTARGIEVRHDAVVVHSEAGDFEGALLVGADGSNGITRRSVLPHEPIHTARALEVLIPSGSVIASKAKQSPPAKSHGANDAYFDFGPIPLGIAGYTWDFPTQVRGEPMRCWGIYDTNLLASHQRPALSRPLADEMQLQGASLEQVKIEGHPIRWYSPRSALSAPRVLLVGDAAGADGIFGEGISIALGFGSLAAKAIRDAVARDDYSFRDYRRRVLLSPLGKSLTLRTAITHALYRMHWSWFQRFFWQILRPLVALAFALVLNWAKRMR